MSIEPPSSQLLPVPGSEVAKVSDFGIANFWIPIARFSLKVSRQSGGVRIRRHAVALDLLSGDPKKPVRTFV
jgi:hypothetical protein